jgi:hypothetical protein
MATTTTVDISAIIPAAVVSTIQETYQAEPGLLQDAETDTSLRGVAEGDRVKIGKFAAATPALNLAETEAIVPKKLAATAREFIVGRIGDAYSYSYRARNASTSDLQDRSARFLGRAFALRANMNLAATALSTVAAGRTVTATGTGSAAVLTPANFIAAVRQFPDDLRPQVRARLSAGQRAALTDAVQSGGTAYASQTVWRDGEIDRFFGVNITTDAYLAATTAGRVAGMLYIPGRTLVEAPAQDPIVEYTQTPATATVDAWMNAWWAGGVQDLDTLTLIDAAA